MNKEESVPVAVSVSSYGVENTNNSVTNVYAQPMTSGGNTSNPTSVPTITAIGYASPPSQPASVRAQALPSSQTPLHVGGLHLEQPLHVDERVLRATTSARSVKCLTVLDLCLILLLTIFQFSWIFLVWGPMCGYIGSRRYNLRLIYVYMFYWGLRALIDAVMAFGFGYLWFIVSFVIDLYIIRYIWQFCAILKAIPAESLSVLQNTTDGNRSFQTNFQGSRV